MLEYAEKITSKPWEIHRDDVENLRRVGFKDADILSIVQITAYYAFVNRIVSALGVELEGYWNEK